MEVNILVAFFSGLVSFFAPCVVPLVPAYVGYISGVSVKELRQHDHAYFRKKVWLSSGFYVFGFSLVFVLMGTAVATFGTFFRQQASLIQQLGGVLIMILAMQLLGFLRLPQFSFFQTFSLPSLAKHGTHVRAFLIGVLFASTWTPCVGPVLGVILTLAATTQTVLGGAVLLFFYSLGIMVPFLFLSGLLVFSPKIISLLESKLEMVHRLAGIVLLVLGFLLFNNSLKWISPLFTYDTLNQWLFALAFRWGYLY